MKTKISKFSSRHARHLCFVVLLALTFINSNACGGPTSGAPAIRAAGTWTEPGFTSGCAVLPTVIALTGCDLKPYQTKFRIPELADPYMTFTAEGVVVSGTAQYHLKFKSYADFERGGPYQIVWNDFYYSDGTPMEGERFYAHSWDMKPVLWNLSSPDEPRLWDANVDRGAPKTIWYGGHMRPRAGQRTSRWPDDNFSRDVFAFSEKKSGMWFSEPESIFVSTSRADWPREQGNFLGHRYGHQMVMVPKMKKGRLVQVPSVFYEEVTEVKPDGTPAATKIFSDEMVSPFKASGRPSELMSPINPVTGKPFPRAVREDGSTLIEGPLYFRFKFEGEEWEAIGFSTGSYYGRYGSSFASRKVSDGLMGRSFLPDLTDDGSDLNDAGAELTQALQLIGAGRPAVIVRPNGEALVGPDGNLQLLSHGYRRDISPNMDPAGRPLTYRFDQMFRVVVRAFLTVAKGPQGGLRFKISVPQDLTVAWPAADILPTPSSVN